MISIIICSRTAEIKPCFFKNIEETIGSEFELLIIDNSDNKHSIFEAYNLGIKRSKGRFWCFLHDDIIFHTKDWGLKIEKIFRENLSAGLIGIAGTKLKTRMPSTWFACPENQKIMNLIQHIDKDNIEKREKGWKDNENNNEEVVIIDGVFMVGKRDDSIIFDERLKGFHNYDLNLSIAYKKANYKILVTREILLEHLSLGKIDRSWYKSTLEFDSLYARKLPLQIENVISSNDFKLLEFELGREFCLNLIHQNFAISSAKYYIKLLFLKPQSKFYIQYMKLLASHFKSKIYNYLISNKLINS